MGVASRLVRRQQGEEKGDQHGVLARKLPVHQGGVRDEALQNGRMVGEC